jgi:shikimate 5-dehydrogenase
LTRQGFLTGLIGAPIAHSASPAMHEQAARALFPSLVMVPAKWFGG